MITPRAVKTKYLFLNLLHFLKPAVVLDVGSMNGADSLRFRRMVPQARLVAFEANQHLYQAMRDNPAIAGAGIEVRNQAVSPVPGSIRFYVSRSAASAAGSGNRGTSSTMKRVDPSDIAEEVEVPTIRLDEVLAGTGGRAALWIDVEGAGYEVLSTLGAAAANVDFIHIETELRAQWQNQKLKDEVLALAESLGFTLIGHGSHPEQQDLVLVNARVLRERGAVVRAALLLTRMHGPASSRILAALP